MASLNKWQPEEVRRFYRAFHKYGTEFDKVSKAVGGGKHPELCEALWRHHQAYLSLDRRFQSEVAFTAMVQDATKREGDGSGSEAQGGEAAGPGGLEGLEPGAHFEEEDEEGFEGEGVGEDLGPRGAAPGGAGEAGAAAVEGQRGEDADLDRSADSGDARPLVPRARRTPKRTPPSRGLQGRTPLSSAGKRARAVRAADDDIYAYYDAPPSLAEGSARKRRAASAKRLEFGGGGLAAARPQSSRRREAADEAKGIDALLALAVAGAEEAGALSTDDGGGDGAAAGGEAAAAAAAGRRRAAAARVGLMAAAEGYGDEDGGEGTLPDESCLEDEEEEDSEGEVGLDDEDDEDFRPGRRTPASTPAKRGVNGRFVRTGQHATPRRLSRGFASPGGRLQGQAPVSPGWGLPGLGPGDGSDLLGELGLSSGELGYLASPALAALPPGYVPSPAHPLPRLRRRKSAPQRTPPLVSPMKTLFTRRQSLAAAPPLMMPFGYDGEGDHGSGAAAAAGGMLPAEVELRHCLTAKARKWCMYEFFYSAIDRPWFLDSGMRRLLAHVGLGATPRLTRREWSLLRSALGRPRRLSLAFLRAQRAELAAWRQRARAAQQAPAAEAAPDAPRTLTVGQRVTARHPATGQLHDGSVLTIAASCYRIQFDRRELGVELIGDVDIMPADPGECLSPASLEADPTMVLNGRSAAAGQATRALATARGAAAASAGGGQAAGQQRPTSGADAAALADLTAVLDRKEALLAQLRAMNDEASAGLHLDASGAGSPAFVQAYASVVLQLKEINEKVQGRLMDLERRGHTVLSAMGQAGATEGLRAAAAAAEGAGPLPAASAEALSLGALTEARGVIEACRRRLADAAASAARRVEAEGEEAELVEPPTPARLIDWSSEAGRALGGLIEGCAWALLLLQHGAERATPPATLSAALDHSLQAVKPQSQRNVALYDEITAAMGALKTQLSAVA